MTADGYFFLLFSFAQRAFAALRALALRCFGVSLLARASPPSLPPLAESCRMYSRRASCSWAFVGVVIAARTLTYIMRESITH